jgi:hypothetical protein
MAKRIRTAVIVLLSAAAAVAGVLTWSVVRSGDVDLVIMAVESKSTWFPLYSTTARTYFIERRIPLLTKERATELLPFTLATPAAADSDNAWIIADALLAHGADINGTRTIGASELPTLHQLIIGDHFEAVRYVLTKGADPKKKVTSNMVGGQLSGLDGLDAPALAHFLQAAKTPPPHLGQIIALLDK